MTSQVPTKGDRKSQASPSSTEQQVSGWTAPQVKPLQSFGCLWLKFSSVATLEQLPSAQSESFQQGDKGFGPDPLSQKPQWQYNPQMHKSGI